MTDLLMRWSPVWAPLLSVVGLFAFLRFTGYPHPHDGATSSDLRPYRDNCLDDLAEQSRTRTKE